MSKLSVGGMGTVYKAEHTLIGKAAAVKVLHKDLTKSEDILKRFFNEAKATTTIKHPGIVEIFDYGHLPSGDAYLTMEFLEGMSLARRCKMHRPMSEGEAAMVLRGVCSALAAAHGKGIVHRDLKPDNIFLVPDPDSATGVRPKVLDFGIAKLTDIGLAGSATKTGAVMGTPTYMSPEQCRGTGEVDHRADLYSIGCIYYELLTGQPPFTKLGAGELIGAHLYVSPQPPSTLEPSISPDTEALIMSLLDKDPGKRPQTARELAQRLMLIAQQHGWVTPTSPTGVTAQTLSPLTPPIGTPTIDDGSETEAYRATVPSAPGSGSETSMATRSAAGALPSIEVQVSMPDLPAPVDKPTTLSGAASQSEADMLPRSRKGLAYAMAAAALLAGGAVAVFRLSARPDDKPAAARAARDTARSAEQITPTAPTGETAPAASTAPASASTETPATPTATGQSAAAATPATTPTTATSTTAVAGTEPVQAATPTPAHPTQPDADAKPPQKPKASRPTKPGRAGGTAKIKKTAPETPPAPAKTKLIETDL